MVQALETRSITRPVWLQRQLAKLLTQKGHAQLLQGSRGLGQYGLAMALAKTWLCEVKTVDGCACEKCDSCVLFHAKTHGDLRVLMPETYLLAYDWPLSEAAQSTIDEKKRKPSKEIRVDAMRDAIEFTQRTSTRGGCKVLVIYPAELMNNIAANTLLKTLEEPPGDTRFVLVSESSLKLLPTLRSRCLVHNMSWPSREEALAWLCAQGKNAEEAAQWIKITGERVQDIERLQSLGVSTELWQQIPKAASLGDAAFFKKWPPAFVLEVFQKLCHDLLAVYFGAQTRYFDAKNIPAILKVKKISDWGKSLEQEAKGVDFPFKEDLFLEALTARAREVFFQ